MEADSQNRDQMEKDQQLSQPPTHVSPYTLFTKWERITIVGLVALAGWFSTLSSFIYYPAISSIARDLNTSVEAINFTVTSYLLTSGVFPAFVAVASDNFGRRPIYLILLAIYVSANVGIALQHSFVALLLLRVLQSAGISGSFSVAYGVVADIARPSERGIFVGALSLGITTAPSLGPIVGGALSYGPGWRWIFWFLAIAAGFCLLCMILALPETGRALVGNGEIAPPRFYLPILPRIMRPWTKSSNSTSSEEKSKGKGLNPFTSLFLLRHKDIAASITAGSIIYMVYCCINASLSSTFIHVYGLNRLQAGLIYLPFGIGGTIATLTSGKLMDHDYRVTAKSYGLPIDKVRGDDIRRFPIEEARLRSVFIPTFITAAAVISYAWVVDKHTHIAYPLVCQFFAGVSIQTCFNINNTLVIDIHHEAPSTIQASFNFVRCCLAAGVVAGLEALIDKTGFGWAFTFLGLLCLISAVLYFVERKCGRQWRSARQNCRSESGT